MKLVHIRAQSTRLLRAMLWRLGSTSTWHTRSRESRATCRVFLLILLHFRPCVAVSDCSCTCATVFCNVNLSFLESSLCPQCYKSVNVCQTFVDRSRYSLLTKIYLTNLLPAEPSQRTEEQTNQIAILRRALGQVQQHQAKVKEDMIYARNEVCLSISRPLTETRVKSDPSSYDCDLLPSPTKLRMEVDSRKGNVNAHRKVDLCIREGFKCSAESCKPNRGRQP